MYRLGGDVGLSSGNRDTDLDITFVLTGCSAWHHVPSFREVSISNLGDRRPLRLVGLDILRLW